MGMPNGERDEEERDDKPTITVAERGADDAKPTITVAERKEKKEREDKEEGD